MKILKTPGAELTDFLATHGRAGILNAGCGQVDLNRDGFAAFNVDVVDGPHVDLIWNLNVPLPKAVGRFDVVVCVAVLQYCRDPQQTLRNLFAVMRAGGVLFIDVPFVQQYCEDSPDRWRFTDVGLRGLLEDAGFVVETLEPGIRPGSAVAWLAWEMADNATPSRIVNVGLRMLASALLWPLRFVTTLAPQRTAGSFYAIARRVA